MCQKSVVHEDWDEIMTRILRFLSAVLVIPFSIFTETLQRNLAEHHPMFTVRRKRSGQKISTRFECIFGRFHTVSEPKMTEKLKYEHPLVDRYASKQMSFLWSPAKKFSTWRKLWLALAEGEQEL